MENKEITILRELAYAYMEAANDGPNAEKVALHKAVNDLKQLRPVVLIDELPWHEMNFDGSLTLHCTDPVLREVEWTLRTALYQYRHFRADRIYFPFLSVPKQFYSTGIGLDVQEYARGNENGGIYSHEYLDQLQNDADLERLHPPVITYDERATMERYTRIGEVIGDILPLRITGVPYVSVTTWDDIARYHGVTNLLMDLADRPEFMHRMVSKLTDFKYEEMRQMEQLGLFDSHPAYLHCTAALSDDLPEAEPDGTRKIGQVWGRGTAQIFGTVSKSMHEEFDIEYMKQTVGQCGLVYYGCCEPLDKKVDIVEKIPHLRKISITPWADIDIAAEVIQNRYAIASKPNPAAVAVAQLDQDALKQEIGQILQALKRNQCSADIVLKDISTCCGRPENIFKWVQTVMEMVEQY